MSRIGTWTKQFKEASRHHGGECIGLAIGVRALDAAFKELGISTDTSGLSVRLGTKECLGDAFRSLLKLEDGQIEYVHPRDDTIIVRNGTDGIMLHLTSRKFSELSEVFEASDNDIFPATRKLKF